jgi:dTDP-4-amino-4,6-dideoxygalactose transaminase
VNERPEPIPMLDLVPEIEEQWDDLMKAVEGVLRSGKFILGPNVDAFEEEIADYLGVKHAIGVNSGTDALMISLRALGIGPGDEVITTPFTFFATAESISNVGATPIFVDIDPITFNIDPELIEPVITSRTKAILPVHLFGHPAEMGRITEIADAHGLKVVEDCAQAIGAEYDGRKIGTFGQANAFSFFPSKNLGALGDAGLLTTDDERAAELARMLRAHGSKQKYENESLGYNSRMDELQAALLRVRLPRLDAGNAARRGVADRYRLALGSIDGIVLPDASTRIVHAYHQFTIRVRRYPRDEARSRLRAHGIASAVYYPIPCHMLGPYRGRSKALPVAESAATEVLSLPMWSAMTSEAIDRIASLLW